MKSSDRQLYLELLALRQRIKETERRTQGRAPVVCDDAALLEIARLRPRKLADFECVSGVGKAFVENYAREFLAVVLKFEEAATTKNVEISPSVAETLKELEKKTVNVNRRNRLLYMPKIVAKSAFDLFDAGKERVDELLFGSGASVSICEIERFNDDAAALREANRFKKLTQLLREVNKDIREKGQNDLYVAYPFAIGRLPGENFDVRAPLALFPVAAERTATGVRLALDESRDAVFNAALILATFKFNNVSKPLPACAFENYSAATLFDVATAFYAENDLRIVDEREEFRKFREYKADEFPRFRSGEIVLEPCAVLGKFPICAGAIQKDFDAMLKSNEINPLLNELLLNADEIDCYVDAEPSENADEDVKISERDLFYFNDLNGSQETVLAAAKTLDALVVQGPPGTGKSQTIAALLASFVDDGKTVLLVSEKKTALDVVYSRLGDLASYALLIDDVGNKDAFYRQLLRTFELGRESKIENAAADAAEILRLADEIDAFVARLEAIADKFCSPGDFGLEPRELYRKNRRIDLSDPSERDKIRRVCQKRDASLLSLRYERLAQIRRVFSNLDALEKLERFLTLERTRPLLKFVRGNLSELDALELESRLARLKDALENWRKKNVVVRFFTKRKISKQIRAILDEYCGESKKEPFALLFGGVDAALEDASYYEEYQELKPLYGALKDDEKTYFDSTLAIEEDCDGSLANASDYLFNATLFEHISRFETENRAVLQDVERFGEIVRSLSDAIEKKKQISRRKLEAALAEGARGLTASKRRGEILRVLESKRKWSVHKFVQKFRFELMKSVKIWLATPEVVSEIFPLETGFFDLVVFDEASQMYVEKGVPAIQRAKKVVVVGDSKQLRPASLGSGRIERDEDDFPEDADSNAAREEESLLDLARFKYRDVLLNYHYRSKYEELIAFSNYAFYRGRLFVTPNAQTPERPPIEVCQIENAVWNDRANVAEAKRVVELLKEFFEKRTGGETVGIITFNVGQRDLIDDLIDEECANDPAFAAAVRTELTRRENGEDVGLFVKNIENVQGDERDVILFSVGYAKNADGRLIRKFGWLNQRGGENRLNVAVSRARKKVCVVVSFDPAELRVEDLENDGPRLLKKYLQYAFAVSDGDQNAARQILASFGDAANSGENLTFDSDFEKQVYDKLVERGYRVETQVGVGGYRIDLAIKKDGKYVLGIECDGRLYHSSKSARERDFHRQKYLESRGWRIYRVWSSNWWKSPNAEIAKICAAVEAFS